MIKFTKADKKKRTIMLPQMLEYHSALLKAAFESCGYMFDIMHSDEPPSDEPLRYISGDYCYPSVLIVGQILETIKRNGGRTDNLAFMEPQAGGACRAGNIYDLIIKLLDNLGYSAPVISLNFRGDAKHPGFKITPKLVRRAAMAVCCGDLLMLLYQQTKPYEINPGETDEVYRHCEAFAAYMIKNVRISRKNMYLWIIKAFNAIKIRQALGTKKRVGVAGEIYIKFSSLGNHNLERFINEHGYEVYFGGFLNYIIYIADSEKKTFLLNHKGEIASKAFDSVIGFMNRIQREMYQTVKENSSYSTDFTFLEIKQKANGIISRDCITGDGWLIAAEVVQAIEKGCKNVLIVHPFGCLVSHVCVRGIIRNLKEVYKDVNIQSIEYDYDQSRALCESRLLLGLSNIS